MGRAWELQNNSWYLTILTKQKKQKSIREVIEISSTPCSWENSQELIKWFEGRAQIKAYIQLTKILDIRGKWCIVIGIKPENKISMVASIFWTEMSDAEIKKAY